MRPSAKHRQAQEKYYKYIYEFLVHLCIRNNPLFDLGFFDKL